MDDDWDRVTFEFDTLPKPNKKFRAEVSREAKKAFGSRIFWRTVSVTIELRVDALEKHLIKGDVDNYIKQILDGLTGIAYNDDNQVVAVEAYFTYSHFEGVKIDTVGRFLVNIDQAEEFVYKHKKECFTFLIPRDAPKSIKELIKQNCRFQVKTYYKLMESGMPKEEAKSVLTIIYKKYPRKGSKPKK